MKNLIKIASTTAKVAFLAVATVTVVIMYDNARHAQFVESLKK